MATLVGSTSLGVLVIAENELGDACLGPLIDALPSNAQLHTLDLTGNRLSEAFIHNHVLPAVHANTRLTTLSLDNEHAAAREAMDFVKQRPHR